MTVLLSAAVPERLAKATDAVVIPPEFINGFLGRLRGTVIARRAESDLTRSSMRVQPMVIMVAKVQRLGRIAKKIKAWSTYVDRLFKPTDRLHRGAAAVVGAAVSYYKSHEVGL
ncbi:hydrogenase accessory protein [Bradyrhizobium sp. UFLA05-109]